MLVEPGTLLLQRYRVLHHLRSEGLGEVFQAEHIDTGRPVAVKLLGPPVSRMMGAAQASARFRQEGMAARHLRSDHLIPLIEAGDDDDHGPTLVFERRDGELLITRLRRTGPLSFAALRPLAEQIWMALQDIHAHGVLHRDVSPYNLLLDQQDGAERVTLLNLGSCKLPAPMGGQELTQVGQSVGDFAFMPPEQMGRAKTVDRRADIYAATTVMFQALSGQLPFSAGNLLSLVELKTKTEPRRLGEVMSTPVHPMLDAFVARGLARDPEARFATAAEALAALRAIDG